MLYMVIERFRGGTPDAVGERFRRLGRLMPDGLGLSYISSWIASDGTHCYQIMEAPDRAALDPWIANWSDLVDFDVTPIAVSADYWAERNRPPSPPAASKAD